MRTLRGSSKRWSYRINARRPNGKVAFVLFYLGVELVEAKAKYSEYVEAWNRQGETRKGWTIELCSTGGPMQAKQY